MIFWNFRYNLANEVTPDILMFNRQDHFKQINNDFDFPPLSPPNGVNKYIDELFEKDILETLGFTNGI